MSDRKRPPKPPLPPKPPIGPERPKKPKPPIPGTTRPGKGGDGMKYLPENPNRRGGQIDYLRQSIDDLTNQDKLYKTY
jgi:hypothetical protein